MQTEANQSFIPLAVETRSAIPTDAAAHHLSRRPQTLRAWACLENGPYSSDPHKWPPDVACRCYPCLAERRKAVSGPEIDFNKLRNDGLEYASNQLWEVAQVIAIELGLRESPEEIIKKRPTLVLGTALLAHLDERAEERRIMREAQIEVLGEILSILAKHAESAQSEAGDDDK